MRPISAFTQLIRAIKGARNSLLDLEELEEEDLDRIRARYEALAQQAREKLAASRRRADLRDDAEQRPTDEPR